MSILATLDISKVKDKDGKDIEPVDEQYSALVP